MDQLSKIKDSVLGYFSPKRNDPDSVPEPKRRRTFGPRTPSKNATEEHAYGPMSEPRGKEAQAARNNLKHFSRQVTKNPLKRSREDEERIGNAQGDGENMEVTWNDHEEDTGSLNPEDSTSQLGRKVSSEPKIDNEEDEVEDEDQDEDDEQDEDEDEDQGEDEDEEEEEEEVEVALDDETLARERVQEYLARQAELALKKEAIQEVKQQGGWHKDEVFLFERLSLRSYEALFPQEWHIDFGTLPAELFHKDKDQALINFNHAPSYHGVKALQKLLGLGLDVRAFAGQFKATEYIVKALKDYTKWCEKDGDYFKRRSIPVLTVVTGKPKHSTERISKNITAQMQFLARKHREFLLLPEPRTNELGEVELYRRPPPLLYGIIVAQTIAIFVTLDSSNPEAKLRHISHFDFKEPRVHVWHGIALAIICVVARNYTMSVKDEFEVDDESSSDPDA